MKYPLMKCGHTANAIFKDRPCCIICAPNKNAFEINKDKNSLKEESLNVYIARKQKIVLGIYHFLNTYQMKDMMNIIADVMVGHKKKE